MSNEFISRRNFVKIGGAAAATFAMGGLLSACASSDQGGTSNSSGSQAQQSNATGSQAQQSSQSSASTQETPESGSGKILVAYYSAQGHTRAVAETAADELGADLFEIVPTQVYSESDLDWTNSSSRVSVEHDNESQRDVPLVKTAPDNWADYDTVLVGYPIWWGIAAWPCDHFAADNNFAGKKVIPFCTSSSSGLGQSGQLLASAAGTGDWQTGQRFSSSASDTEVRTWAKSL